ncbi:MAG TPA: hypothetical protein VIV60_35850 [Polyangiaceae bacterium]
MAQLIFKPRPKMHSWTAPEPRAPRRNWFYFWAIGAWLLTVAIAYRWFSDVADDEPTASSDGAESNGRDANGRDANGRDGTMNEPTRDARERDVISAPKPASAAAAATLPEQGTATQVGTRPARAGNASVTAACEDFIKESNGAMDGRLPTHLERSPVDAFIGENAWTKPCRTRRRHTAQLCVAIQDGEVKGLSAVISPPDLSVENCLREQAAKLVLQPEGSVRVIRTSVIL